MRNRVSVRDTTLKTSSCAKTFTVILFAGTYFILYDFIDFFEKDGPSYLQRDKYNDIINTIFKNMSQLEREAIVFQVSIW